MTSLTPDTVLMVNPGADVYGSDLQLLESVTALVEGGSKVFVACPGRGPLVELLTGRGSVVRLTPFPVLRRAHLSPRGMLSLLSSLIRSARPMWRLLSELRPSAVYVNTTTIPWWIAMVRLRGIPVVCHVHEAEDAASLTTRALLNAPLLAADQLILISQTAATAVWRVFPRLRRKSIVVMNGVPDRTEPPTPFAMREPRVRLVVVGRLSPRKAPHVAVRALKILGDQGIDATLEIAGTPFAGYEWYEQELRDEVRDLHLMERVSFTGYVHPSHRAFDRADIVIAPSVREPFGNVVVEAQLSGRPVVAAAYGGHLESIEHGVTGLHVAPGRADAVAEAVKRLVADASEAQTIAVAARESALDKFGIARYQAGIRDALAQALRA